MTVSEYTFPCFPWRGKDQRDVTRTLRVGQKVLAFRKGFKYDINHQQNGHTGVEAPVPVTITAFTPHVGFEIRAGAQLVVYKYADGHSGYLPGGYVWAPEEMK